MSESFQYLFGPVPSRRLGRSLGVDLIPFKTCTMDCIYCQLGGTTCETAERSEYVPVKDVLSELRRWMKQDGHADCITLAGSGEPTLHLHFGEIFRWVRTHSAIPSVLLTNGSLLHLPEVRADAALADKVKVTLSAWDEPSFRKLHRPAEDLTFEKLVDGERSFRGIYSGELSVEVFIVEGLNSELSQVRKIAGIVESICPDRIDINAAVRPPAESGVKAPSSGHLQRIAEVFGPKAGVTASCEPDESPEKTSSPDALLALIQRHPATAEQLAGMFNESVDTVSAALKSMVAEGLLRAETRSGDTYYLHRAAD